MNSSSQSFAPVSRLLWKEYRVQRAFWLAMLLFGVVPQFLIRIFLSTDQGAAEMVWSMAAAASLLFVIGSTAILFAGEREERTHDWLRHLAVAPLWILVAKWGLVLIAALLLGLLLSVNAVLMVWSLPISREMDLPESISRGLWLFAGFFLWGSLGSLVSRRVVTAVPAMGFWWLMTMVMPMVWLPWIIGITYSHPWHQRTTEIVAALACVFVGLADIWLGWRWCQGKYLDAQVLDDLNTNLTAWLNRVRGRTLAVSRIPSRIESTNSWRREWQRLIWQERHRESYHRMLLYLAWMVVALLAMLTIAYQGNPMMPGILPLVLAFPLAMGLLGFRYDGQGQPIRFLAGRGVSARLVWMAKHAVWLPRAFWIPLVVCLTAAVAEMLTLPTSTTPRPVSNTLSDAWNHRGMVLLLVLVSYGSGQLAALFLRRMILAVTAGVVLNVSLANWLLTMQTLDVPLWWSVGTVAIWLFLLSYWYAPTWLLERRIPDRPLRLVAGLVLPPVLLVGSVAFWRADEVSGFGPASPTLFAVLHPQQYWLMTRSNYGFDQRRLLVVELQGEIERQSRPMNPEQQAYADKLAVATGEMDKVSDYLEPVSHQADLTEAQRLELVRSAQEKFWAANEPRLKAILEVTQGEHGASPSRWRELRTAVFMPQQNLLLEAGRLRAEQGRLQDAITYYCASLRLASFWANGGGFAKRQTADLQQRRTLEHVIQWASRSDQTAESLKQGQQRLRRELSHFPSWRETLVAEYRFEESLLEDFIKTGAFNAEQSVNRRPGGRLLLAEVSRVLPWERRRARNLLEQDLMMCAQSTALTEYFLNQPGMDVARYEAALAPKEKSDAVHAHDTTPLLAGSLRAPVAAILNRETFVRETLLAFSLLIWKMEHAQWPDSLYQLLWPHGSDDLPMVTVIDPWSGELFHYNGQIVNELEGQGGRMELLSSVGPEQLREVPFDNATDGDHRSIYPTVNIGLRNWRGDRVKPQADDRLRIEILRGGLVLVDR